MWRVGKSECKKQYLIHRTTKICKVKSGEVWVRKAGSHPWKYEELNLKTISFNIVGIYISGNYVQKWITKLLIYCSCWPHHIHSSIWRKVGIMNSLQNFLFKDQFITTKNFRTMHWITLVLLPNLKVHMTAISVLVMTNIKVPRCRSIQFCRCSFKVSQ
jgi:hypothetical protein